VIRPRTTRRTSASDVRLTQPRTTRPNQRSREASPQPQCLTSPSGVTRRQFVTAVGAGLTIVPRHVLGGQGHVAPSDKTTIATIGAGREGMSVMMRLLPRPDVQFVAVCDVNRGSREYAEYSDNDLLRTARELLGPGHESWGEQWASPGRVQLTKSFSTSLGMGGREPAAQVVDAYYAARSGTGSYACCNAYADYRELLATTRDLDAVYVATPDHWHAPIAIAAMKAGKHVLGQKPMCHTIGEARRMAAVARETKVATSITVNNPSTDATRLIAEWLADGAIGSVREVHNWSSRPYWPQGVERPRDAQPAPSHLDWDAWLGPAPARPYHRSYQPFAWRGWFDFGCGSFGDMGCYSFAGLFTTLGLVAPVAVEASTTDAYEETFPQASIVHLDFPARGPHPPLRLSWYDGGLRPPRPSGLLEEDERRFRPRQEGVLYVGETGLLVAGFNGDSPRVYPASPKYPTPPRAQRRPDPPPDHAVNAWLAACRGKGPEPLASFPRQEAATEALLLGCLAQRLPGERFEWDTGRMRVSNSEKAHAFVDPPYRDGFRG
jgi:predicted dehydrogenase